MLAVTPFHFAFVQSFPVFRFNCWACGCDCQSDRTDRGGPFYADLNGKAFQAYYCYFCYRTRVSGDAFTRANLLAKDRSKTSYGSESVKACTAFFSTLGY